MKMPTFCRHVLPALLAVGAFASAWAADVATDPVGYVSNTIPGQGEALISAAFHRSAAFASTVSELVDEDTIKVSGTPGWATDSLSAAGNEHYLLISSGARTGMWAKISHNGADTLDLTFSTETLGTQVGNRVEVGDSLKVIQFWTLGTLLPETALPEGSSALIYNQATPGINKSAQAIYILFSGYGWYDGPNEGNSLVIYPDESLIVRNPTSSPVQLTQSGTVPMHKFRTVLVNSSADSPQELRLTTATPVPVKIRDLLDPGAAGDQDEILIFDNAAAGINKSASQVVTYFNGYGWYDGPTDMNNYQLQPGQGFLYRKAASNSATDVLVNFKPSYQP